ncbi:hypothetical protein D9M68_362170 [compost metagenome]
MVISGVPVDSVVTGSANQPVAGGVSCDVIVKRCPDDAFYTVQRIGARESFVGHSGVQIRSDRRGQVRIYGVIKSSTPQQGIAASTAKIEIVSTIARDPVLS